MVRLGEANPAIWETIVSQMEEALKDREFSASDIELDWKRHADARKLEREIFAKYGYFKDVILHPQFQQAKQWLSDTTDWLLLNVFRVEPLLGEPVMPTATCVIILFMLQKRVSYFVLALIGSFMFNVNPLYVVVVSLGYWWTVSTKKPKQYKQCKVPAQSGLVDAVTFADWNLTAKLQYDHVIIGSDMSALYAAALLSKVGHSCLVLQPKGAPLMEISSPGSPCTVPIHDLIIGKVHRYKALLDIVQWGSSEGKVHFTPLGKECSGFAHTIVRVTQMLARLPNQHSLTGVSSFRAGAGSTADALVGASGCDRKNVKVLVDALAGPVDGLTAYLHAKAVKFGKFSEAQGIIKGNAATQSLAEVVGMTTADLLDKSVKDANLHALLNGLSIVGSGECSLPSQSSAFGLANFLSSSEQGLFYPIGGVSGLRQALVATINAAGGAVVSNVPLKEIVVEDGVATGARLADINGSVIEATRSVVSCTGVLNTMTRLLAPEHVSVAMRQELSPWTEARPKVHVLFWLSGTLESLGLHNVQMVEVSASYQLPAFNLQNDATASADGTPKGYVDNYCKITVPSAMDPAWATKNPGDLHCVDIECELPEAIVTREPFNFGGDSNIEGPKMYVVAPTAAASGKTTLVEDTGSVGSTLQLKSSVVEKLKDFALERLRGAYPQAVAHVLHTEVVNGILGGFRASSNVAKFAGRVGSHTDIPGLFLAGSDIATVGLMGEIQSGLMTANAVLGYSAQDLQNGTNLFNDLSHMRS